MPDVSSIFRNVIFVLPYVRASEKRTGAVQLQMTSHGRTDSLVVDSFRRHWGKDGERKEAFQCCHVHYFRCRCKNNHLTALKCHPRSHLIARSAPLQRGHGEMSIDVGMDQVIESKGPPCGVRRVFDSRL